MLTGDVFSCVSCSDLWKTWRPFVHWKRNPPNLVDNSEHNKKLILQPAIIVLRLNSDYSSLLYSQVSRSESKLKLHT